MRLVMLLRTSEEEELTGDTIVPERLPASGPFEKEEDAILELDQIAVMLEGDWYHETIQYSDNWKQWRQQPTEEEEEEVMEMESSD